MALLTRALQKIFGLSGGTSEFGQIGSKAAGTPVTTKNLETMQDLTEYEEGLSAIVSDQGTSVLPYLEDINSLFFLITSQLAYLMQSGVAEWNDETEYYKDVSFVVDEGVIWKDIFGTVGSPNLNFKPSTNPGKWTPALGGLYVGNILARLSPDLVQLNTIHNNSHGIRNDSPNILGNIDPTSWSSAGTLSEIKAFATQAIIGDYIYIFGGFNGSAYVDTIIKAPISDPTSWSSAGTLSEIKSDATQAIIGDYIYIFGGRNSSAYVDTIIKAPISDPTSWSSAGTLSEIKAHATQAIIGDYIYIFGGFNGSAYVDTIIKAPISDPTSWSSAGTLSEIKAHATQAIIGDYIYIFGGFNGSAYVDTIIKAPISDPTSWSSAGTLSEIKTYATQAIIGDYIYIFGGRNSSVYLDTIIKAPISDPTSWSPAGTLSEIKAYATQAIIGDYIYIFGGHNGSAYVDTIIKTDKIIYKNADNQLLIRGDAIVLKETTTPTADTGYCKIYPKSDNNLYLQDGAGFEHEIFHKTIWTSAQLVGSGLSIAGTSLPALCALNGTDVAFIDDALDELRCYRFNGSTWSLVGSGLSIAGISYPALCALNGTDVAFIDSTFEELGCYRFNGSTWSLVGSGLSIAGISLPALCALNGTDVAFIDGTLDELRCYRFGFSLSEPYHP